MKSNSSSERSGKSSASPARRQGTSTTEQERSSSKGSGKGTLTFSMPGDPKTKLRPRFSRHKGKVRTYDSQSEDKNTARWQIKARMVGRQPFEGPLSLTMVCVFTRPKSRERLKEVYHTVKPDLDNVVKWLLDVGNGTLWYDDKQIVSIGAVKIYGEEPRTIVTVSECDDRNS